MKKIVLITGASSGIGLEFARIFASNDYELILAARSLDKLNKLAKELEQEFNIKTHVIKVDLGKEEGAQHLYNEVKKKAIVISDLVNAAGFGTHGNFTERELEHQMDMIDLNIKSLCKLCHLFANDIKKTKGRILNIASTAAYQPIPGMAVYSATKTFVYYFSEALNSELSDHGASVTTLSPGPTKTNFAKVAGMDTKKLFRGKLMSAHKVAQIGFNAMMKRKHRITPGFQNKVGELFTKLAPIKLSTYVAKQLKLDKD